MICKYDDSRDAGEGTYIRNGFIHASLAGFIEYNNLDETKVCFEVIKSSNY